MSGIVGHVTYALLAASELSGRESPLAPVVFRHLPVYLAGSYLGCDIQTLPAAICEDTGRRVGYGSSPIEKSPLTGGKVRPWRLEYRGREISPREIHEIFYGRSHLILGWTNAGEGDRIPLSSLVDYGASVAGDAVELFGPGDEALAYVLGWLTHVMGDGLIKSVINGINLNLLGGTYTAQNRPVQDLVSFNEVGIGEWGLDWSVLLDQLANTPVELVQVHYMRCGVKGGRLGAHFENGWNPGLAPLLERVLEENRSYQRVRNVELVAQLTVTDGNCDPELCRSSGGLSYAEMKKAAEAAGFREALTQMGILIADFFERIVEEQERLQDLPKASGSEWEEWLEIERATKGSENAKTSPAR